MARARYFLTDSWTGLCKMTVKAPGRVDRACCESHFLILDSFAASTVLPSGFQYECICFRSDMVVTLGYGLILRLSSFTALARAGSKISVCMNIETMPGAVDTPFADIQSLSFASLSLSSVPLGFQNSSNIWP
jgi:hypothetical protein